MVGAAPRLAFPDFFSSSGPLLVFPDLFSSSRSLFSSSRSLDRDTATTSTSIPDVDRGSTCGAIDSLEFGSEQRKCPAEQSIRRYRADMLLLTSALRSRTTLVLVTLVSLSLQSCARRVPIDYGPFGVITDPEVILESIQARREAIRSVSGEARLSAQLEQGSGRVGQFVLAEKPDRVRLETISFFGQPLAVLTSDGLTFHLHDLDNGRFYSGAATAGNVSQLLPVRLPPEELVSLLLGIPPLILDPRPVELRTDDEERAYVLTVDGRTPEGSRVAQEIGVDTATLRPVWVEMPGRYGSDRYGATFRDYAEVEGLDLPRRIALVSIDGSERMELQFRDRDVNLEIEPDAFTQEPPPGVETLWLE